MISASEARLRVQDNLTGFPAPVIEAYLAFADTGDLGRLDEVVLGVLQFYLAKPPAVPLVTPVLPRALTRFRLPWRWDGNPAVLKSRATDDTGAVQPERDAFIAEHGHNAIFHWNGIQAWSVAANGEVKHVYA